MTSAAAWRPATEPTARARALARLYDLDLEDDPGDLDLYLALAGRAAGPILELAAGSGRLAVPLAAAGHEVAAVDLDPAMLERARDRAREAGTTVAERLELIEADMLDLPLPAAGTYRLAFIALNSLFLLGTRAAQEKAIATLAGHLVPGGIVALDIWLPEPDDLARFDGRLILDYVRTDPATGSRVTKITGARYDPARASVELTAIYEEGADGAPPVRWVRQDTLRLLGADELRAMVEDAGLVIEEMAGDHDLQPLGPGSERVVVVAVRRG